MNYYALIYEVVDNFVELRKQFRDDHLRKAKEAHAHGDIVLAGAFAEPADRAMIIFHVDDKNKVGAFAKEDPYVVHKLVKKWEVRPWTVVIGQKDPALPAMPKAKTITRHWMGNSTRANLPNYVDHFSRHVLPQLRQIPGYLGATLSVRNTEEESEILVATSWESMESIRKFAGNDVDAARVTDEAAAVLRKFERRVVHYEVVLSDGPEQK